MKKIFWLIVLLWTWYIISIFLAPTFADKIWDLLGIKSFNEQIRNKWWDLNKISTNIPNSKELQKSYDNAIKKAWEFKNTVVDWIDKTKNTIDEVRATLSWAEDTIDKAVNLYDETTETVDKLKETFNDVDKMREKITDSVNTENVK
jgi:uncharacterized coiled-coil DUF342 family protein